MRIRAGFEISYDCPQPTPMILELSVHPSRTPDLLTWDRVRFDPPIPANTYHDVFGNFCHVIRAPAGRLTMSTDFLVQDKASPTGRTHRRSSTHSNTYRWTLSSFSSAADIARPIASPKSHGPNSEIYPKDGA
jgi:hypothetical protein